MLFNALRLEALLFDARELEESMAPRRKHRSQFRDRADYYRGQAVRALEAAAIAKEPVARASLLKIAEAWQHLAQLCQTAEVLPSVLSILPMVEDSANSEQDGQTDSRR